MVKVIAGLGNVGSQYTLTRHNVGFLAVDSFAALLREEGALKEDFKKKQGCFAAEGKIGGQTFYLIKADGYMNLSGEGIGKFLNYFKISSEDMLLVYDDADLEFGRFKFQLNGGYGAHNGVASVVSALKSNSFSRCRIGIGRPKDPQPLKQWVLSKFTAEELQTLDDMFADLREAFKVWLVKGISAVQNAFNKRMQKNKIED